MSFEEASCLGVAGLTAAMSLWHWLEVPGSPALESQTISRSGYILIWGGSTVTGQFAIQMAVLGGLRVIAVTSAKTAEVAEMLGAVHVVVRDGKSGDQLVAEIRAIADDDITRGIDLVGPETASLCLKALSGSQRTLFAPLAMISSKTQVPQNIVVETVEMKLFVLQDSSSVYAHALNRLIEERKLVLPQLTIVSGGLEKVLEGLERIKKGDMGGKKMIVRLRS
jgi:NADPH:quinone reductase-like Zn-dependent oxidoreductase